MRICVTRDDIAKGRHFNPDLCPVALALTRAGLYHFGVFGAAFLLASSDCVGTLQHLPESVSHWIARFDAGSPVNPVKFDVELPRDVHRRTGSQSENVGQASLASGCSPSFLREASAGAPL